MLRSLLSTLIVRISKYTFIFIMQQMASLGRIVFIRGGGVEIMDYWRAIIKADMRPHTKYH